MESKEVQRPNANLFSSHSFLANHLIPLDSLPPSHRELYFSLFGNPHKDMQEDGKTLRGKGHPSNVSAKCCRR